MTTVYDTGVLYGTKYKTRPSPLLSQLAGKQPLDPDLSAIAALTGSADTFPYYTGPGAASLAALSNYVRTITGSADALAFRTGAGALHGKAANVVVDFGADPTGLVNATSAIQAALDAVTSGEYRGIYIPAGLYTITPGVLTAFTSKLSTFIYGDGGNTDGFDSKFLGTILQSDGTNPGEPLLFIDGSNGIHIKDIAFWGNDTAAIDANNCVGVRWSNRTGDGVGAGSGTFERVAFLWCTVGFDNGYWDGVDPDYDGNNCDTYCLIACLFWMNTVGIRSNQDQNVIYTLFEPGFFGNPGDSNIAIDAVKGGNITIMNLSTYDMDYVFNVTNGGNSCTFSVYGGHLDGGTTKRTKLYQANGTHGIVHASFYDIGCNPNLLVAATGEPFVSVASYQRVKLHNCNFMGDVNSPVLKIDDSGGGDGGTVVLDFCEIPNPAFVVDPSSSGGKYRVTNCVDDSTGAFVPAFGNLDPPWTVTAVKTGAYNAQPGDLVRCDPTGGGFTVTLPAIGTSNKGFPITVKNQSASTNTITIARTGGDTIDGAAASTTITTARGVLRFVSDGTGDWMLV